MLKICLVFWESEPQYAYKPYAYKKKHVYVKTLFVDRFLQSTHRAWNSIPILDKELIH